MAFKTAKHTPALAIATSGTFNVNYPAGTNSGSFRAAGTHKMFSSGLQSMFTSPAGFTVSFGTSNITVTYLGTTSLPAEETIHLQFDMVGVDDNTLPDSFLDVERVAFAPTMLVNLGAPDTADPDGVVTSAILNGAATLNGALVASGVATFDVPRNVTITGSTGTVSVTFTVTGTDEYGETVVEAITGPAGAATTAGKKAFKTITAVSASGSTSAAVTVGNGDVLGLPVFLEGTGYVLKEMQDGAAAASGTIVAGATAAATATTGDVRGTYDPSAAADGIKAFALIAAVPDPKAKGVDQYAG